MPFGMGRFVVGVERCDNRRYGHNSRFGGGSANGQTPTESAMIWSVCYRRGAAVLRPLSRNGFSFSNAVRLRPQSVSPQWGERTRV